MEWSSTLPTDRRLYFNEVIHVFDSLPFPPVCLMARLAARFSPQRRSPVRAANGGAEEEGLEEFREVCFNRSSTHIKRSIKAVTSARTDAGMATHSSGEIPAGDVSSSLAIAFL